MFTVIAQRRVRGPLVTVPDINTIFQVNDAYVQRWLHFDLYLDSNLTVLTPNLTHLNVADTD